MKCIVYITDLLSPNTNKVIKKDVLCICRPVLSDDYEEEAVLKKVIDNDLPANARNITILNDEDIPKDRYFRNAFSLLKGKVIIDENKVVDAKIDRLIGLQKKKLIQIEEETKDAFLEQDIKKAANINAKKKAIKEFETEARKHLKTLKKLEDIKNYIPKCLED